MSVEKIQNSEQEQKFMVVKPENLITLGETTRLLPQTSTIRLIFHFTQLSINNSQRSKKNEKKIMVNRIDELGREIKVGREEWTHRTKQIELKLSMNMKNIFRNSGVKKRLSLYDVCDFRFLTSNF